MSKMLSSCKVLKTRVPVTSVRLFITISPRLQLSKSNQSLPDATASNDLIRQRWEREMNTLQKLHEINSKSPFYPQKQHNDSEDEIVSLFLSLVPSTSQPDLDYQLWIELNKKPNTRKLPSIPEELNDVTLPKYIKSLSELNTREDKRITDYVHRTYRSIVDAGILTDLESYNLIIRFFSARFEYQLTRDVLLQLHKRGVRPTTDTYNNMMFPLTNAIGKPTFRYLIAYLKQMAAYKLTPNLTTWYIVFTCLKSRKNLIYDRLQQMKSPLEPIRSEVAKHKVLNEGMELHELITYFDSMGIDFDSSLLSTFVNIYLRKGEPNSAWELILNWHSKNKTEYVPISILTQFIDHFTFKGELHNAVATINLFKDALDFPWIFKNYDIILRNMARTKNFSNWSILTRRFYLDSKRSFNHSVISAKLEKKLSEVAKSYGYSEFILNKLTKVEFELTQDVFSKLKWDKQHPKFTLLENSEEFQKAADFFYRL
ncbi:hypothetical protein CANARDRAFT_28106 [[Candida] arabinofermentans NRRL YB-2248]|uniref:ATPase expression protein 2, mitochondrial n=1 Tax=[Candida] arabinofermentans NRRL YB-2248 TaxID=983967 RepID=A0A1E4T2T4_9ASCO|nr:hypothetical protein CANARDRAFT_28106 [[Candida] arabinofermentans NRRL YB-2248]